jgi:hypothetical protein
MLMMMTMMMMTMMNDNDDDSSGGVRLTLQSVWDSSLRSIVDVPADSTVRDAVRLSDIPRGDCFDVYTRTGEKVSDCKSSDCTDDTLFVSHPRVSSGASEIEIDLDPADDVIPRHEPMTKSVTFVSAYDPAVRHEVVPQPGQSVRDAAHMAGLAPRDGSGWTVYDAVGTEVDQRPSEDLVGDVLYVGRRAVAAGGIRLPRGPASNFVIPLNIMNNARFNYILFRSNDDFEEI